MVKFSKIWPYVAFVLSIIAIALLIWTLIVPTPLKLIIRYIYPDIKYVANKNAVVRPQYTLYSNKDSLHNKLIVVFIGGALLHSEVANSYGICNVLNEKLKNEYDIVTFNYPVRFKNTLHETMLAINKKLVNFLHYETVHAIGISFGALLTGAFYHKENSLHVSRRMNVPQIGMQFKSFIGISGLFEPAFNVELLTNLFKFYFMRNTPAISNYTCYNMQIPKLIINAKSDFLLAQTAKLIESGPCEYHIYDSVKLPHRFVQFINLVESQDALQRIITFISTVDKLN